jgi:hypothetical protein
MIDIKTHWQSATDRGKWSARGAAFVTKVKATKAVWFPPQPAKTGTKAVSAAKRTTKSAAKKTTSGAKKTSSRPRKTAAKKAAKKSA